MPKYTGWQFRWPTRVHERAVRIAAQNKRSLNAQVLWWLENGGLPPELLDESTADLAEGAAVIGGGR